MPSSKEFQLMDCITEHTTARLTIQVLNPRLNRLYRLFIFTQETLDIHMHTLLTKTKEYEIKLTNP